jgi:hypothetical protein
MAATVFLAVVAVAVPARAVMVVTAVTLVDSSAVPTMVSGMRT